MPVITRWGSHLRLYQQLVNLRVELITAVTEVDAQPYVSPELSELVLSATFWDNLRALVEAIKPLGIAIAELEADKNISCVLKTWFTLESIYNVETPGIIELSVRKTVRSYLDLYWDLMSEDIHSAAYLLDPSTRSHVVKDEILVDAERLLTKMSASNCITATSVSSSSSTSTATSNPVITEFTKFRAKKGIYAADPFDTDVLLYWQRLAGVSSSKELAQIALSLLALPQSCAAVERSFSVVRRIHTWQRNKLGRKKLAKLVFVYLNKRALTRQSLLD